MISFFECACLAEDVYNRENNNLASEIGWTRVDAQNWPNGFAAGIYQKNNVTVISFRGTDTDDIEDILADLRMIPESEISLTAQLPQEVLHAYGVDAVEAQVSGYFVGQIATSSAARRRIRAHANQIPREQVQRAVNYFLDASPRPEVIVGHSLGGALAKIVALEHNVKAIAFNSPFMGDLQGVRPVTSMYITSVNALLDPLSMATDLVGNLAHGRTITVDTSPYPRALPQRPEMTTYVRPASCPRGTGGYSPEAILNDAAAAACEAFMETFVDPVGRAVSAPARGWDVVRRYPGYYAELADYAAGAAGYFHSMEKLRLKMARSERFARAV
jgi:pimeloyl-ACP methyl ester carboxylesterase